MSKKVWYLFFLAVLVLLYFDNNLLYVTDSVECNYTLTAKEMVLSGDYLSPQIFGRFWFDKPIFFYWLTALSYNIFGFTDFAGRFFPALFGLASIALVAWTGTKLYSERVGFFSAVILATSLEFFLISKYIITDSPLFFFFSATLSFFYLGFSQKKRNIIMECMFLQHYLH